MRQCSGAFAESGCPHPGGDRDAAVAGEARKRPAAEQRAVVKLGPQPAREEIFTQVDEQLPAVSARASELRIRRSELVLGQCVFSPEPEL